MKISQLKDLWLAPFAQQKAQGKIGYALLWMLGIPLPLLLVFYFLRGN